MNHRSILVAVPLSALAACRSEPQQPAAPSASAASSASPGAGLLEAQQALDRIDTRKPVPLLPMMANHQKQNMRDHLVAVQAIVGGLAHDDFGAIEAAAKRIGYSEQMGAMCTHMGAGAPGFTDQAITFHKTADTIADAARSKDRNAVVRALDATLATCTGCHAAWKQRVVDDETWSKTAGDAPMPAHGMAP